MPFEPFADRRLGWISEFIRAAIVRRLISERRT
jgi:hypothetical protein